jgi:hypothetical protein
MLGRLWRSRPWLARSWAGRKCLHAGLGRFRGYKARRQMCALMDGLAGPLRNPSASQVHRHPEVPARSVGLEGRRPLRLGRVLRGSLPLAGAALTTLRIAAFATRRQSGTANPSTCLRERTANVGALFHVLQPQLGRHGYLRAISVAIAQWGGDTQSAGRNQHRDRHLECRRAAASAVSAAVAAIAASVTMAGPPQRRISTVDRAVINRFTMPCPG